MYGKDRSGIGRPVLVDSSGAVITGGAALTEATLAGRLFAGGNVAVVTTVAGCTAAAWTGLGLANPLGSGINIIVHEFNWAQYVVATGEGELALAMTSASGFADQIHGINQKFDGPAHKAYLDDGATLAPAGVIMRHVTTISHGIATVTYGAIQPNVYDLKGGIVLTPNSALITVTDIVQTSGFVFGFVWEEVAI
jgi:hypothetical protein